MENLNLKASQKPIEQLQNESLPEYMSRLYNATLGQSSSIFEALQRDPVNTARLINHIPNLINLAKPKS